MYFPLRHSKLSFSHGLFTVPYDSHSKQIVFPYRIFNRLVSLTKPQCPLCGVELIYLTLILLTSTKWRAPASASKWQMGFNSAFKGLTTKEHNLENKFD
jgi:hypothetical protein